MKELVLAGGTGKRLWPVSRMLYPKQFMNIDSNGSLLRIVVKGTAKVVKENEELYLHENESIYVPKSTLHRVENPGKMELHIIEVQTGGYLEEDDIVRIDKP